MCVSFWFDVSRGSLGRPLECEAALRLLQLGLHCAPPAELAVQGQWLPELRMDK